MFLHATWSTSENNSSQSKRIQTPYGGATAELRVEGGKGDLVVLFRATHAGRYMDSRRYGAFGMLLAVCEDLPRCDGRQVILRLTSASELWQNRGVQGIFQRAGFTCAVKSGTLELRSDQSPLAAIEKAAVVSFAVDAFSQSIAKNGMSQRAMQILGRHRFLDGEVLELLGERGDSKLRKLLQGDSPKQENKQRDAAIISALARVKTKTLVQFHSGKFLVTASKLLHLEERISVEPSLEKSQRPVKRYKRLHGSLIEPPKGLFPTATALLLGALPAVGDSRRARAAEVLFKEIGFDWIFCIERTRDLLAWAEEVSTTYGYKVATWEIGSEHAAMFRRVVGSVPRTAPTIRVSLQIEPRVGPGVMLQPEQWASTVEAVSCLTVDPKWLIYLPPRANNLQSESLEGDLEPPEKVFEYYRSEGITKVVLEGKAMAARGVVVVCREEDSARFTGGGSLYRRTGRPLFSDDKGIVELLRQALSVAGFWERFQTDWVCLECEVLPWVLKGSTAFGNVHTPLLEAGEAMYGQAQKVLRGCFEKLPEAVSQGQDRFSRYRTLYEQCVSDSDLNVSLAPVHLIATEGRSYFNQTHLWHMQTLSALVRKAGAPFVETPFTVVALEDERSVRVGLDWMTTIVAAGAQGVTIKPMPFLPKGRRGFAQPSFLCRGREHLRLVYGPEYDVLENRLLLRDKGRNQRERNRRTLKQLALSIEGVERFLRNEPKERIDACIRGVLALDVD